MSTFVEPRHGWVMRLLLWLWDGKSREHDALRAGTRGERGGGGVGARGGGGLRLTRWG